MTDYDYSPETGLSMQTGFGFRTIWVIESLRNGDLRTGKELFDDVLHYLNIKDPELYIEFREVIDKGDLFKVLTEVKTKLETTGQVPLLHFETHGSPRGFQLKSGEFVPFEQMLPLFRAINTLAQNNLFVVAAACHGAHLMTIIQPTDRSPFWGICGPSQEVAAGDVIRAYRPFYEEAATSANMNAALDRLKQAVPQQADHFHIWNSEYLFMLVFRYYIPQYCSGPGLDDRVQAMLTKIHEDKGLDPVQWSLVCGELRERLSGEQGLRADYERFRHTFFMHDLYPTVEHLPNPSLERMMQIMVPQEDASTYPIEDQEVSP